MKIDMRDHLKDNYTNDVPCGVGTSLSAAWGGSRGTGGRYFNTGGDMRGVEVAIDHKAILSCAGMSQQAAAAKLGLNLTTFHRAVHRLEVAHMFRRQPQTNERQFLCDCCGEIKPQRDSRMLTQRRLIYRVCYDCTHRYDTEQMMGICSGDIARPVVRYKSRTMTQKAWHG